MVKTYGELFAGCGGASLGLHRAGYYPSYVVEWNKGALDILTANLTVPNVFREDVCKIEYNSLPEVDLLWASPSCSSYNKAKRNAKEEQADLDCASAIARAARKTDTLVIENVDKYFYGQAFLGLKRTLTITEFDHFQSCTLNAAHYGNPASRERTYAIFSRQPFTLNLPTKGWVPWSETLIAHRSMWIESKPTERQWNVVRKLEQEGITKDMIAVQRCGYYGDIPRVVFSYNHFPCIKSHRHHDGKRPRPGYGKIGGYLSFMDFYYEGQFFSITPQLLGILNGFPFNYCWGANKAQAAAAIGNAVVPRMAEILTKFKKNND